MTRAEYKALREQYRQQWSGEARRQHDMAWRNIRRFACFMVGWVIFAFVLGWWMHK